MNRSYLAGLTAIGGVEEDGEPDAWRQEDSEPNVTLQTTKRNEAR